MKAASIRHALRRGTVHAIIGLASAIALFFFSRLSVQVALAAVTAAFLSLETARLHVPSLKQSFARWFAPLLRQEEKSKLMGASYFLAGCLITVLAFPQDIAPLAIIFLSLGDSTATVIGIWKGRTKLWGKSMEGNGACFVVCLLAGSVVATLRGEPPLAVAIVGAIFATIFQALPRWLNDNLTIPLGAAAAMAVAKILI